MSEANTTGISAEDEQLKQLEALEAEQANELEVKADPSTDKTNEGNDRPLPGEDDAALDPDSTKSKDTLSTADEEVKTAKVEAEKEGKELDVDDKGVPKRGADGKFQKRDKKPIEPAIEFTSEERSRFDKYLAQRQGSKYAKDFSRRLVTWSELNSEKEKFAAAKTQSDTEFKTAVAKFNADVEAFKHEKAASTPTPEKYEDYAQKQINLATIKEAEAVKAEAAGNFDAAEKLKDEAKFARRDAQSAFDYAEHIRKNPLLDDKQKQEKFLTNQKGWMDKAAIDFPDFGKKGSDLQSKTLEYFKQMVAAEPALAKLPGFIYFAAERTALKSAADSVPSLNKELGELRTKVKELETLTNPSPSGGVQRQPAAKTFETMSAEEQFEQLQSETVAMKR